MIQNQTDARIKLIHISSFLSSIPDPFDLPSYLPSYLSLSPVPQVRLENTQTLANDPVERKIPILQLPQRIWARAAQRVFTPLQPLHPEGGDQKGGKDGRKDGRKGVRVRRSQQSDHVVVFEGRATLIWDRYGRKRRDEKRREETPIVAMYCLAFRICCVMCR